MELFLDVLFVISMELSLKNLNENDLKLTLNCNKNEKISAKVLIDSSFVTQMLTHNRIWKQRLVDIGVVSMEEALSYGMS